MNSIVDMINGWIIRYHCLIIVGTTVKNHSSVLTGVDGKVLPLTNVNNKEINAASNRIPVATYRRPRIVSS